MPAWLLARLATVAGRPVTAEDIMAYLAAVLAHPAYTARFAKDLVRPGLRVPLTADRVLFDEAVALGRRVIWLHCYGERFADPTAGRPKGAPRLPKGQAPCVPAEGAIPPAPEPLPDTMDYDPAHRRLVIGTGYIDNVTQARSSRMAGCRNTPPTSSTYSTSWGCSLRSNRSRRTSSIASAPARS